MKASSDLAGALALVRQYAPATYAAMRAARWHVSTWPGDFSPDTGYELAVQGTYSLGLTVPAAANHGVALTYMNDPAIQDQAADMEVPAGLLTAQTLVHEFVHVDQADKPDNADDEAPAFDAAAAFDALLPEPYRGRLAENTAGTRAYEMAILR